MTTGAFMLDIPVINLLINALSSAVVIYIATQINTHSKEIGILIGKLDRIEKQINGKKEDT
jgi:hypothetical protein